MGARRHGQRGVLAPWKCCKVLFVLQMLYKVSVDEVFLHYFALFIICIICIIYAVFVHYLEKMSSASGASPQIPTEVLPLYSIEDFRPSDPFIAHRWKKSRGRPWLRLHRNNRVSVSYHTNDCCTVKVASEILVRIEDAGSIDVDVFFSAVHTRLFILLYTLHAPRSLFRLLYHTDWNIGLILCIAFMRDLLTCLMHLKTQSLRRFRFTGCRFFQIFIFWNCSVVVQWSSLFTVGIGNFP